MVKVDGRETICSEQFLVGPDSLAITKVMALNGQPFHFHVFSERDGEEQSETNVTGGEAAGVVTFKLPYLWIATADATPLPSLGKDHHGQQLSGCIVRQRMNGKMLVIFEIYRDAVQGHSA